MEYRPFLDGLRGFAIVLVVLFHCGSYYFQNGFIGVDIFFVLSGFLISSILLSELHKSQTIDFLAFYARRAKRLLPSSILVLVLVAFLYVQTFSILVAQPQVNLFIGAGCYIANWMFLWEQADYWGENIEKLPILHYWSLSVEEQFYFVFPLILIFLWVFSKSFKIWFLFSILVLLFLYLTVLETNESWAHMSTWCRVYQFLLGAVIADLMIAPADLMIAPDLIEIPNAQNVTERGATAYCGKSVFNLAISSMKHPWIERLVLSLMVLLATPLFTFSNKYQSMLCAFLSAFIIFLSELSRKNKKLGKIENTVLSLFVHIGKYSYSIYLFHWPLIIIGDKIKILPLYSGGLKSELIRFGSVFLASFVLAKVNYTILEGPIAKWKLIHRTHQQIVVYTFFLSPLLIYFLFKSVVFAPETAMAIRSVFPQDSSRSYANSSSIDQNSLCKALLHGSCKNGQQTKRLSEGEVYYHPQFSIFEASSLSRPTIAVVGDSISLMFREAARLISTDYDINILFSKMSGCANIKYEFFPPDKSHCNWENRKDLFKALEKYKPTIILLFSSSLWRGMKLKSLTSGDLLDSNDLQYNNTFVYYRKLFIDELSKQNSFIVAIAPIITFNYDYWECLGFATTCDSCDQPLSACLTSMEDLPFLTQSLMHISSKIVDINPIMCPCQICPAIYNDGAVMFDHIHPSPYYFAAIRHRIVEKLEEENIFLRNGTVIV